ncbi:unnamed protein product [Arabis nemorensis]|uniref:Uncharacterized protein n=1 Tax=Arabis nemorensis TaxID=586526 RepID=A0A565CDL2_9BRAS|nr:unnamed protein product [Arabis nemorensis]VVB11769.1 unnamed protein product [Arabis nemorensis]
MSDIPTDDALAVVNPGVPPCTVEKKRTMHCGVRKQAGHNARFHKNDKTPQTTVGSSQAGPYGEASHYDS